MVQLCDEQSSCHAVSNIMAKKNSSSTPNGRLTNKNKNKNVKNKSTLRPSRESNRPKTVSIQKPFSLSDTVGGLVGNGVSALGHFLGFGAYTIGKNTIIGAGGSVPSMHSSNDSIIIRHREYIGEVYSNTFFMTSNISLNPGMPTYPWLSGIARNFQEYRILGMVIEYVPEVSEVSANEISLGYVALAAQYRTDMPPYPSLESALESEFAVQCKPNTPMMLALECDPNQSPFRNYYVRSTAATNAFDIHSFDMAMLNVLVGNQQTSAIDLGAIWISYEIELFRPTALPDTQGSTFFLNWRNGGPTSANMLGIISNGTFRNYWNPVGNNIVNYSATLDNAASNTTSANQLLALATADGLVFQPGTPGNGVVSIILPPGLLGLIGIRVAQYGSAVANGGFSVASPSFVNCSSISFEVANPFATPDTGTAAINSNGHIAVQCWITISPTQAASGPVHFSFGDSTANALSAANVEVTIFQCTVPVPLLSG